MHVTASILIDLSLPLVRLCLCGRDGNQGEIIAKLCICTVRRDYNTKVSQHTTHIHKLNCRDFVLRQCKLIFTSNMIFQTWPRLSGSLVLLSCFCNRFLHNVFAHFDFDWLIVWLQSLLKLQLSPRLTAWLCSHSNKGHFNI